MGKNKKAKVPFPLRVVRWVLPKLEVVAPSLARRYFIRIFFTPLKYPVPEKERKSITFARPFQFSAVGQTIQAYEWGDADRPYVLVVHGWAGRATQFRRFVKALITAGFRVIGFDGPAHGQSTGRRTDIFEFGKTLEKIYQIQGEPAAIIAHSFGGVATLHAAMKGLHVRKLVNIASPTIGDEVIRTYLRAVNGSWKTGQYFKEYIQETQGKTFDEFSSLHFVQNLPAPVEILAVHDENDKEVDISHAEALVNTYKWATLLRTSKLGHTRILRDEQVIRRCVKFIADQHFDG
jgi:pimeloyl-ACP methyl ester carboxylesterase